jgi:hypothetical protein
MATAFKRTLPALICQLETGVAAIACGWGDLVSMSTFFLGPIIGPPPPKIQGSKALPRPNTLEAIIRHLYNNQPVGVIGS